MREFEFWYLLTKHLLGDSWIAHIILGDISEDLEPVEGNPNRDLWKLSSWEIADEVCLFLFSYIALSTYVLYFVMDKWHCHYLRKEIMQYMNLTFAWMRQSLVQKSWNWSIAKLILISIDAVFAIHKVRRNIAPRDLIHTKLKKEIEI